MNNGKEESIVELQNINYEKELDSIIDKIGISFVKDDVAIETLNLTHSQLNAMDQQECCILSYKLQQYGLYINSIYNRLENIKNWAEQRLSVIVGKYAKNYGDIYTKYEEKRSAVIAENSAAEAYLKIILKAGGKAKELNTVSQKISAMATTLLEISKSKRYYHGQS